MEARIGEAEDILRLVEIAASARHPGGKVYNYVFRGQSVKHADLVPRSERPELECPAFATTAIFSGLAGSQPDYNLLHEMLIYYKRTIHNFQQDLPRDSDWLEWMSLIQHFGGPTRLLDFTESAAVGLYFAVRDADAKRGGYLWMLHQDDDRLEATFWKSGTALQEFGNFYWHPEDEETWKLSDAVEILLRDLWQGIGHARRLIHYLHDEQDYNGLIGPPKLASGNSALLRSLEGVVLTRPFRMNRRLLAQQGCFATCLSGAKPFMQQLIPDDAIREDIARDRELEELRALPLLSEVRELIDTRWPVTVRIWVPPHWTRRLAEWLRQFNVTGQSLFPDFEGNTQAMNEVQRRVDLDVL
jgi:hypothetical protein